MLATAAGWILRDIMLRRRLEAHLRNRLSQAEGITQEADRAVRSLRYDLGRRGTELRMLREALDDCQKELTTRDPAADSGVTEIHSQQLEESRRAIQLAHEKLVEQKRLNAKIHKDLEASHKALFQCDQRVIERESRIADLEARFSDTREMKLRFRKVLRRKEQRIAELTQGAEVAPGEATGEVPSEPARTTATPATDPTSTQPFQAPNDLKVIKGIGPALEHKLNDLGVTSLRQIAGWDDTEIDRIAAQLGAFRDRIRRDDWVGSAQKILAEQDADD